MTNKYALQRISAVLTGLLFLATSICIAAPVSALTSPDSGPSTGGTAVSFQGLVFVDVSVGEEYSLGLTSAGDVYSWGDNSNGQLGNGSVVSTSVPTRVSGINGAGYLSGAVSISAGNVHGLAMLNDGKVVAWGNNDNGQLGDGTGTTRLSPVLVLNQNGSSPLSGIETIAAGGYASYAITDDNKMLAWGYNQQGELGNNTTNRSLRPGFVLNVSGTTPLQDVVSVSPGDFQVIAVLADGTAVGWGDNYIGQLGTNTNMNQYTIPTYVVDSSGSGQLTNIVEVSSGYGFGLARSATGEIFAWGENSSGQLGDGTNTASLKPVRVKNEAGTGYLSGVSSLQAGYASALALMTDGSLLSWGSNYFGELGVGSINYSSLPVAVKTVAGSDRLSGVSNISIGYTTSGAQLSDGTILQWGHNSTGQVGNGSTSLKVSLPVLGAHIRGVSVNFGANAGTYSSNVGSIWSVTSPTGNSGLVQIAGVGQVFGGNSESTSPPIEFSAGTFTYEAALANTGTTNMLPFGLASACSILLGAGLLLTLRRQQKK